MTKNQIMIDHACNDKRSVSAMLHGEGDGREQFWLAYENTNQSIDDMELLMETFRIEVRYGRVRLSNKMPYKNLLAVLAILFVVF
ncbi:MAG: hypothetical protein ACXW11_06415 [Methylotenera sp.]